MVVHLIQVHVLHLGFQQLLQLQAQLHEGGSTLGVLSPAAVDDVIPGLQELESLAITFVSIL